MDAVLTTHGRRVVSLLNERAHTQTELRTKLRCNGTRFKETMAKLYTAGVVNPPRGLKDEALRLTPKGEEIAASLAVISILTDSN